MLRVSIQIAGVFYNGTINIFLSFYLQACSLKSIIMYLKHVWNPCMLLIVYLCRYFTYSHTWLFLDDNQDALYLYHMIASWLFLLFESNFPGIWGFDYRRYVYIFFYTIRNNKRFKNRKLSFLFLCQFLTNKDLGLLSLIFLFLLCNSRAITILRVIISCSVIAGKLTASG